MAFRWRTLHLDLDKGEWRYLVMKTRTGHRVPLSTQAIAIVRELHALLDLLEHLAADSEVFMKPSLKEMSDEAE
ncbi:hypothetical protein WL77_11495 [Burkholderia ubonensis]|uniref:hypothetical protein n=1 Tax=Burkholderia ubonensis TaxID=101571 RepID=UPI00075BE115|nr:hypothetical protein [Burkholderia ubonensis]KWE70434.1 hypothetical protein WL77_11495 [Burkholderia ubonensis]KWE74779.1 hypothetical protein WL79_13185 [Burkholderia ubonensis]